MRIIISLLILFTFTAGCASDTPRRNPLGETFPKVSGQTLNEEPVTLPDYALAQGEGPVLLLVAYKQNAQFDVDRWLIGLMQAEIPVRAFEVPTVDGLVPGLISGTIDDGMRSGIPPEDWAIVITIYDDADKVVEFTGNEDGLNARVILLENDGTVAWFHDRGFSARELFALKEKVAALRGAQPARNAASDSIDEGNP